MLAASQSEESTLHVTDGYTTEQPARSDIDALGGAVMLNFGTDWCGYCRGAERLIDEALGEQPQVRQVKVEDGPGRLLGRSFRVKLWPTLVFLRDGLELARLVRPLSQQPIAEALSLITSPATAAD